MADALGAVAGATDFLPGEKCLRDRFSGENCSMMPSLNSIQRFLFRVSEAGGAIAIISFPFSVSLSQLGSFLALLGWVASELMVERVRRSFSAQGTLPAAPEEEFRLRFYFPYPLIWIVALYTVLFVSLSVNALLSVDTMGFFKRGMESEMKTGFLFLMALWVLSYGSVAPRRRRLEKWLFASVLITIAAGFASLFSLYRLSKIPYHLTHGWETTAEARYQHTQFVLGPIPIYLPIGLMNTHLTYAAHVSMMIPFLLFYSMDQWLRSPVGFFGKRKSIIIGGLLVVATMVLIVNNGRSAIFGLALALVPGLYYFLRQYWKKNALRLLIPAGAIAGFLLLLFALSPTIQNKTWDVIAPLLGKTKHTDFQRELLWKATFDLIQDHPITGVGAGAYEQEIEKRTLEYSKETPDLWYAYSVIQRGHAHNDYIHFLSIGGGLAVFFYMAFIVSIVYLLTAKGTGEGTCDSDHHDEIPSNSEYARWGALVLIGGGVFQSYMLDSETLLPFWILLGYAMTSFLPCQPNRSTDSKRDIEL